MQDPRTGEGIRRGKLRTMKTIYFAMEMPRPYDTFLLNFQEEKDTLPANSTNSNLSHPVYVFHLPKLLQKKKKYYNSTAMPDYNELLINFR